MIFDQRLVLVVLFGALLYFLRQISLPTVVVISKFVRSRDDRTDGRVETGLRSSSAFLRIWVQNADGAPIGRIAVSLDGGRRETIRAVRAVGGSGRWKPNVVAWDMRDRAEALGLRSYQWAIGCESGMRPHATWRIEVELSDTMDEIALQVGGRTLMLGRGELRARVGPYVSMQEFALFGAVLAAIAGMIWAVPVSDVAVLPLVVLDVVFVVIWSFALWRWIRPIQAGFMSGWGGIGDGRRLAPDGTRTQPDNVK